MKDDKYGEGSFEYYAEKYYDDIYRFIFSIVYNKDWVPDIAQNTMEKAFKKWHSLRKRESVKSWLCSIAKNETASFLEKIYRQNDRDREYMNEIQEKFTESIVDEDILNMLIYKENFAELTEAWKMLDDKYKQIIALWTSGDYSEKEIAKILGMNYNTVRTNLRRGIQKLRELYAEVEKGGRYEE
ncbi:MAG: RNA polymerase sigma factor [Firmicutes bacterium]|nr:RNA polymerase sigma factor [Bacillota bacterium]